LFAGAALVAAPLLAATSAGTAHAQTAVVTAAKRLPITLEIDRDFPDPSALNDGKTFYAYSTSSGGLHYPVASAPSATGPWTWLDVDAMPNPPAWSDGGYWAPDVSKDAAGGFLMYFTAHDPTLGHECVGVARSTSPKGPFIPQGTAPLVCPGSLGGGIDASAFTDPKTGKHYMLYKNDGNSIGVTCHLWIQQVSKNGTKLIGKPHSLIVNNRANEDGVIEAPYMTYHAGHYALFYSAGSYGGAGYEENYAESTSPTKGFTKAAGTWLTSAKTGLEGPGGVSVFRANGKDYVVFHAWRGNTTYRAMYEASLGWTTSGKPVIGG
jgi:beta-xylosidase